MHAALQGLAALRQLLGGPPLTGPRLVIPLPPFAVGSGAHLEVGFEDRDFAVRLIRRDVDHDDFGAFR